MLPTPYIQPLAPPADFLVPDNVARASLLSDLELGSLLLFDPTGGLRQATWEGYLDGQTFKVWIPPSGSVTSVLTVTGTVTELSMAFDSNMRPHFAYVEDGVPKFYWYDTSTNQNTITPYPGITSPRLCLDDKRDRQSASRDVLMFYLREGSLYCRQQRDRYEVEYFLQDTEALAIDQVGMAAHNRLRIELIYDAECAEPLPIVVVLDTLQIAGKVTAGTIHRNLYTVATGIYPVEVDDQLTATALLVNGFQLANQIESMIPSAQLLSGDVIDVLVPRAFSQYPEAIIPSAQLLSGIVYTAYTPLAFSQYPEAFIPSAQLLLGTIIDVPANIDIINPPEEMTSTAWIVDGTLE